MRRLVQKKRKSISIFGGFPFHRALVSHWGCCLRAIRRAAL
jgi:hypothetical protein